MKITWKRLGTVFLAVLILAIVCSYLGVAASGSGVLQITSAEITNGSLQYTEVRTGTAFLVAGMNFTITLNESVNESCEFMWNNNGTLFTMTNANLSANNRSFNYTWFTPPEAFSGKWQNVTFRCGNGTLKSWYNTSSNESFLMYRLNNDTPLSIGDIGIVNSSIITGTPILNISIAGAVFNATNCTYNFNATGEQSGLMAQSPNRQFWSNASGITSGDTPYSVWTNITYNCTNSVGNYSTGAVKYFQIDTTKPSILPSLMYAPIGNASGSTFGNYLTVYFNISDQHPNYCGLSLYFEDDGYIKNVSSQSVYNASETMSNCTVNVTAADIDRDGYVDVVPFAKDNAGNENTTGSNNQSYVFFRLKEGWNIITGYENKTLTQIAMEFPNVTYVSVFDNAPDAKNFTTFTVGGTTNANIPSNHSSNKSYGAALVYVNDDVNIIRRHYSVPVEWQNVTLYSNTSVNKTKWNLVGVTSQLTNVNSSMMQDVCTNETAFNNNRTITFAGNNTWMSMSDIRILAISAVMNTTNEVPFGNYTFNQSHIKLLDSVGNLNNHTDYNVSYTYSMYHTGEYCSNVTWCSFYSSQDGEYCSWYRNRLATSCSMRSNQYNLTRADGLWIALVGNNTVLKRGSWT